MLYRAKIKIAGVLKETVKVSFVANKHTHTRYCTVLQPLRCFRTDGVCQFLSMHMRL